MLFLSWEEKAKGSFSDQRTSTCGFPSMGTPWGPIDGDSHLKPRGFWVVAGLNTARRLAPLFAPHFAQKQLAELKLRGKVS